MTPGVPAPEIVVTDVPDPAGDEVILRGLLAFNDAAAGPRGFRELRVMVRDPADGTALGGMTGHTQHGWLFIKLLWLPERFRGTGIGTELMRRAEAEARARGCVGVWLDTFSFQARGFYERLGYRAFGEIPDHPPGEARHFLLKRLVP
jgi:GNAT superfamily N-acetyltransferase